MAKKKKQANIQPDGLDIEFSQELADAEDKEAQARSAAADARAHSHQKKMK